MDQYLTVNEVAKRCRVTAYTVRNWVHSGRLPATKPGKSFLISEEAVRTLTGTGLTADEYLQRLVDQAPPLNDEQIAALRVLVGGGRK